MPLKLRPSVPSELAHFQTPAIRTLGLVGGLAGALLIVLWLQDPQINTVSYEAAKICLQVLGLVVLGGVVALATARAEHSRQENAALRQAVDAQESAGHQYREEAFRIRADLLDRTVRCASTMYVTCRHVERVRAVSVAGGEPIATQEALAKLLADTFLRFAAEGLTMQTEVDARFKARRLPPKEEITVSRENSSAVEDGYSSLRWHQIYDLLTLYYFCLTDALAPNILDAYSKDKSEFHSGLQLGTFVNDLARPTPEELQRVRAELRTTYVQTMPELAGALLNEPLSAPSPPTGHRLGTATP